MSTAAATTEKTAIDTQLFQPGVRRVLLLQSDETLASSVRTCLLDVMTIDDVQTISSITELHEAPLDTFDIAVIAADFDEGSGMDAITFVRGVLPSMAVVLTGDEADGCMAAEAIRGGALDFIQLDEQSVSSLPLALSKALAQQGIRRENDRLQRELSGSFCELAERNAQLRRMVEKLEAMARTDDLTGLCNRRWLTSVLERCWAEATRFDRPLAFMMIDLDAFKALNDSMGHQCGDEMLRLASRVIEANCRQVDVAARYGGDEFCILMPQTQAHEATRVGERILREFSHCIRQLPDSAPPISMSIGVAHIDLTRPINAEELILHADEAMYAAKASGKACVRLRGPSGPVPV